MVSHAVNHKGKQVIYFTFKPPVSRQPFCFLLSVQYSINYMRYFTVYYKIGFVLDDLVF